MGAAAAAARLCHLHRLAAAPAARRGAAARQARGRQGLEPPHLTLRTPCCTTALCNSRALLRLSPSTLILPSWPNGPPSACGALQRHYVLPFGFAPHEPRVHACRAYLEKQIVDVRKRIAKVEAPPKKKKGAAAAAPPPTKVGGRPLCTCCTCHSNRGRLQTVGSRN